MGVIEGGVKGLNVGVKNDNLCIITQIALNENGFYFFLWNISSFLIICAVENQKLIAELLNNFRKCFSLKSFLFVCERSNVKQLHSLVLSLFNGWNLHYFFKIL